MSLFKQYSHRGNIKTIGYSPSRSPTSPELKILLDLSASPRFYEKIRADNSHIIKLKHPKTDHERLKEADTHKEGLQQQITRIGQTIAQLQSADEEQRREIAELKAKEEAREHELGDQLRYEVVDRFCRGLADMLCRELEQLPDLLSNLASDLRRPALKYAPNAFVLLTYFHHYNDGTLPQIFHGFSEHVHQRNVATLENITSGARSIFTALDAIFSGSYSNDIHLLIYLWAVRASLGDQRNMSAHPVPDIAFASKTLNEMIPDSDQKALMEQILPSLVEEDGVNEHIRYFHW